MHPYVIVANDMTDLWLRSLRMLVEAGQEVKPRGMPTVELRPATLQLTNSLKRWVRVPERRLEEKLGYVEALQLLSGVSDPEQLRYLAPQYARYINSATGQLDGAYPPRVADQIWYVLRLLQADPDSRQAVITIYGPQDHHASADIPCTVSLHFMVRKGALELVVYMRSNDVWLGLPYDVFMFTCLQEAVARHLGLAPGPYTHIDGSLHLYERNRRRVAEILEVYKDGWPRDVVIPAMTVDPEMLPQDYGSTQFEAETVLSTWWASRQLRSPWTPLTEVQPGALISVKKPPYAGSPFFGRAQEALFE